MMMKRKGKYIIKSVLLFGNEREREQPEYWVKDQWRYSQKFSHKICACIYATPTISTCDNKISRDLSRLWVELVPQRLAMYWKKKKCSLFHFMTMCPDFTTLHTFSNSSKGFSSEDERVANRKEFIRWWKSIETCERMREFHL